MTRAFAWPLKRYVVLPRVQLGPVVVRRQAEGAWKSFGVDMGNRPLLLVRQRNLQPDNGSGSMRLRHMWNLGGTWWEVV